MKIWAEESIIVIDRRHGQSEGNTKIWYQREISDANIPLGLWFWRSDQASSPQPAFPTWDPNRGIASDIEINGVAAIQSILMPVPIKPGEQYVFRLAYMVNGKITTDGKEISVFALLKDGESNFGIVPLESNMPFSSFGGTYIDFKFNTQKPAIGVYCEFDHQTWNRNILTKILEFKNKSTSFKHLALNGILGTNHHIHLEPLCPGNIYFFIALLMDSNGRWQFFTDIVLTKKRQIEINIKQLHIDKARTLLEDNLIPVNFNHSITIANQEDGLVENIQILHSNNHIAKGSNLLISRPFYLFFVPHVFMPTFLHKIQFKQRGYNEDDYVFVRSGSHGGDESESIFIQQDENLNFPIGYRENDLLTKSIISISDNLDFQYTITFEYKCDYY